MVVFSDVLDEWTECVHAATCVLGKPSEETGAALCMRWQSTQHLFDEGKILAALEEFRGVEEYFCECDPIRPQDSTDMTPHYASWHHFAASLTGSIYDAIRDMKGHQLACGLQAYTETQPESTRTATGTACYTEKWRVREESGENPIPRLLEFARRIVADDSGIRRYYPRLVESHEYLPLRFFLCELDTDLERESQQAWLVWRRLPNYATDPAAAERVTDDEVEAIIEAKQERRGISELRLANAYHRDKAWLEKYNEAKASGTKHAGVAVLEWWNGLSQDIREKHAGNREYAHSLPDGGRGSKTRAGSLEQIKSAIKQARKDLQNGRNGKPD